MVLDALVLLAAEGAAHVGGGDADLLLGQAEGVGDVAAAVVDVLLAGADEDTPLLVGREGEGGLGLHEGVVGEGSGETKAQRVGRGRDGRGRVAALEAEPGEHVAALVEGGGAGGQGLVGGAQGRKDLVLSATSPRALRASSSLSAATRAIASPTQRVSSPTATRVGQSATTWPVRREPGMSSQVATRRPPARRGPPRRRGRGGGRGDIPRGGRRRRACPAPPGRPRRLPRPSPSLSRPPASWRRRGSAPRRVAAAQVGLTAPASRREEYPPHDLGVAGAAAEVALEGSPDLGLARSRASRRGGPWPP